MCAYAGYVGDGGGCVAEVDVVWQSLQCGYYVVAADDVGVSVGGVFVCEV